MLSILGIVGLALWAWAARLCRQNAAEALAQAGDERRRFLQRLDHELKNPLTAIRAGLANVGNGPDSSARSEALTSVVAQVMRLSRLTADLRKLAELETRSLECAPVDIGELLREAVALAQEQPESEGRHLTLMLPQAPWPVPEILGDWDLLLLATYNLLDNALKFTRIGDTIEVRGSEDGTCAVIEVADTGTVPGARRPRCAWQWPGTRLGARYRRAAQRSGDTAQPS